MESGRAASCEPAVSHATLRLRDSEEVQRETAAQILTGAVPNSLVGRLVERIVAKCAAERELLPTAHRALPDAQAELAQWQAVERMARERAASRAG